MKLRVDGLGRVLLYPVEIRSFCVDFGLAGGDFELFFRDLEDLSRAHFAVVCAVAVRLVLPINSLVSIADERRAWKPRLMHCQVVRVRCLGGRAVYLGSPVYSTLIWPQRQLPVGILL